MGTTTSGKETGKLVDMVYLTLDCKLGLYTQLYSVHPVHYCIVNTSAYRLHLVVKKDSTPPESAQQPSTGCIETQTEPNSRYTIHTTTSTLQTLHNKLQTPKLSTLHYTL